MRAAGDSPGLEALRMSEAISAKTDRPAGRLSRSGWRNIRIVLLLASDRFHRPVSRKPRNLIDIERKGRVARYQRGSSRARPVRLRILRAPSAHRAKRAWQYQLQYRQC